MNTWVFIIFVAIVGLVYFLSGRRATKKIVERFSDRESLELADFYERYYSGIVERQLVDELLEHVACELAVPVEKLRPSDRFDCELKPEKGWEFDSGHNMLFIELRKLAKEKGKKIKLETIQTLDDYIRKMAELY